MMQYHDDETAALLGGRRETGVSPARLVVGLFGLLHVADVVVSVVLLVLGTTHYSPTSMCPHNLERWLIVNGTASVILVLLTLLHNARRSMCTHGAKYAFLTASLLTAGLFFRVVWLMAGSVWVLDIGSMTQQCDAQVVHATYYYMLALWSIFFTTLAGSLFYAAHLHTKGESFATLVQEGKETDGFV